MAILALVWRSEDPPPSSVCDLLCVPEQVPLLLPPPEGLSVLPGLVSEPH